MDFPEFDHMTLDELRTMRSQIVASWRGDHTAAAPDKTFFTRLTNAIAEREKTFGNGPGEPAN